MRTVLAGSNDPLATRVYFDIRLLDGFSPALTETGLQPFVSINGGSWTGAGIGILISVGYGKYYAQLDPSILSTPGDIIKTIYTSLLHNTQDADGDDFQVVNSITGLPPGDTPNVLCYGSVSEADLYFSQRLNVELWTTTSPGDKRKGLVHATQIIDQLNFAGDKISTDQPLQFPRSNTYTDVRFLDSPIAPVMINPDGSVTTALTNLGITTVTMDSNVPNEIKQATYLIALALLDGWDPDMEAQNMHVTADRYGPTSTQYDYSAAAAYILAGLPSNTVWNLLRPFLRDPRVIELQRES